MLVLGSVGFTPVPRQQTLLSAAAFTGSQVVVSDPIYMGNSGNRFHLEIVTTGTPNGTFAIEGSNQYDPVSNPSATFVAEAAAAPAFPTLTGTPSQTMHGLFGTSTNGQGAWLRLRYTNTSGTGTLSVYAFIPPT